MPPPKLKRQINKQVIKTVKKALKGKPATASPTKKIAPKNVIERHKVVSSNLKEVEYDPSLMVLTILFQKGRVYNYYGVPPFVHKRLLAASSKGIYFERFIRHIYQFKEVKTKFLKNVK